MKDPDYENSSTKLQGVLMKWTNYILGWKSRFFQLDCGQLCYYKSEDEMKFGCRGSINLSKATVAAHQLDDCRFDVYVCDLIWYLRANSPEERLQWFEALTEYIKCDLKAKIFTSKDVVARAVDERLREMKTFRDLLTAQASELETVVDNLTDELSRARVSKEFEESVKRVVIMFKATASSFLNSTSDCVDAFEHVGLFSTRQQPLALPEMDEGLHCSLKDEEFFDAVESGLERIEEEAVMRKRLEDASREILPVSYDSLSQHPLGQGIGQTVNEQIRQCCSEINSSWSLVVDNEWMQIFTREQHIDGLATDPLRASCVVEGITAREVCHYFFLPQYRKDWETTLEQMEVVERIGPDTMIFHQVYKRIWPASQRDTLFWSHMTRITDSPSTWAVINNSTTLPQYPDDGSKYIRVTFSVCLHCVTNVGPGENTRSRENISCKISYCASVNPGGWIPNSAARAIQKREFSKFLLKFTSYVTEQTRDHKPMF